MNEATSPYNLNEIAKAKSSLAFELNKESFRFLHRRVTSFARTHSMFPDNLWEGPDGRMEHIRTGFPMPAKTETNSDDDDITLDRPSYSAKTKANSNDDIIILDGPSYSAKTKTKSDDDVIILDGPSKSAKIETNSNDDVMILDGPSDSNIKALEDNKLLPSESQRQKDIDANTFQSHDPLEQKLMSVLIGPSCSQPVHNGVNKNESALNSCLNTSDHLNTTSSTSVKKFLPKLVSDDFNSNHMKKHTPSISNGEKQHWIRLSNLQKKIHCAQNNLGSLKSCFKNSDKANACKQLESMHWDIHGLITTLAQEKRCRDKNTFQSFQINSKQPVKKKKKSHSTKLAPQSYSETWLALKQLCHKFRSLWRLQQSVLTEFNILDDASKSKFQSRLKKIAPNDSNPRLSI